MLVLPDLVVCIVFVRGCYFCCLVDNRLFYLWFWFCGEFGCGVFVLFVLFAVLVCLIFGFVGDFCVDLCLNFVALSAMCKLWLLVFCDFWLCVVLICVIVLCVWSVLFLGLIVVWVLLFWLLAFVACCLVLLVLLFCVVVCRLLLRACGFVPCWGRNIRIADFLLCFRVLLPVFGL